MKFRKHTNSDIPEMERTYPKLGKYVAFLMAGILLLKAIPFEVLADELSMLPESTVSGGDVETEENVENTEDELETSSDELVTEMLPDESLTNDEALTSDETATEETPVEGLEDVPDAIVDNTESVESVITDTESVTEESIVANQTVSAGDASILTEQSYEQVFSDAKVTVTGNLPEGIVCTIEEVELLTPYEKLVAGTLSKNISYKIKKAYDINLYLNDEIYQPEEHDTYVTVSVEGLEESDNGYVIHRIEDDSTVTDVTSETENTSVSFDAVHFTIYTVGEETIDTSTLNVVDGYPVTYLGLTCTLYDDGTMVVEGVQTEDSNTTIYKNAPWYQNNNIKTIYANYNANGYSQSSMFWSSQMSNFQTGDNFNLTNVTNINNMFRNCTLLTTVDVTNFDTSTVTDISGMFYDCKNLITVDLSKLDTSLVTDISAVFYGCVSLSSLNLNNFNTNKVTQAFGTFYNCKSLKHLNISSFDMSNFDMSDPVRRTVFLSGCTALEELHTPYNMPFAIALPITMYSYPYGTEYTSIGNLTSSILLKNTKPENTTWQNDYDYVLDSTASTITLNQYNGTATELVVPGYAIIDGVVYQTKLSYRAGASSIWGNTRDTLTSLVLEEGVKLPENSQYTFCGLNKLTSLDVSKADISEVKSMKWLFNGCSALVSLNISGWDTSNVTNMTGMFKECSSLTSLDLSNLNTSNVTNMCDGWWGGMFQRCSSLTSIDTSLLDISKITDMSDMFRECASLTSLDLSNFNTSNITDMSGMFRGCTNLQSITFGENFNTSNVTDMNYMFECCSSLTSLDLSNFDTSSVTDMSRMFGSEWGGCSSLTSLDVSSFNTSKVTNMSKMFFRCSSLTSLNVSNFDTSNVTNMHDMFRRCSNLTSIDLSSFNTSKVTDMSSMFTQCDNLTSITFGENFDTSNVINMSWMFGGGDGGCAITSLDLSNFDTSKVTNMSGMFSRCGNLESIIFGENWDTSNVTNMSEMFGHQYGGVAAKSLDLSMFDTSKVTNMSGMFARCPNLESLDLSNFDISNVTNMYEMFGSGFGGCPKLKSVTFGNTYTASKITNVNSMFTYCTALEFVDISNFNLSTVEDVTNMFAFCNSLQEFYTPYNNALEISLPVTLYENGDENLPYSTIPVGLTASKYLKRMADTTWQNDYSYTLSDTVGTITLSKYNGSATDLVVPAEAIVGGKRYTTKLRTVTNSNNCIWSTSSSSIVTSLLFEEGVLLPQNIAFMFNNCKNLVSLDISKLDTSNVTNMKAIFQSCKNLTSLNVGNLDTSNVTNMDYMFYGCTNLSSLDISNFNTSNVTTMRNMFAKCNNLESITFGENFSTSKVTNMMGMFYECNNVTSLNVGNLDTSNVTDMSYMFAKCNNLESITFGENFSTSKVTNMMRMFYECNNVTSLNVGNLDTSNVTNMSYMFYGCTNLSSLNVSSFDTSKVTNMNWMFFNCTSLTSLDLSNFNTSKVTDMSYMFVECTGLTSLDVSNFNTLSVENMEGMFSACTGLTSLDLSNFDTSNVTNMRLMFNSCLSLTSLDLSNFNTLNVTDMGCMFYTCFNLTTLDISSFEINNGTEAENMFGCLYYEQVYNMLIEMGLTEEICQEQMGMSIEAYIYNKIGLTPEDNLRLECIKTPKSCAVDIALPGTYYTHPNNTEYSDLPTGPTESITLYAEKLKNGYSITVPCSIEIKDGKAAFSVTFAPEEAFEEDAKVVLIFNDNAKIILYNTEKAISVNNGSNVVEFTLDDIATKEITVTIPDTDNVKAGNYEGVLDFTIQKVYQDAA